MAKVSAKSAAVAPDADDLLYLVEDGLSRSWALGAMVTWLLANGIGSGDGDVVGPASVTDGNLAAFDTTTGKLLKELTPAQVRTLLALGTAALLASDTDVTLAANSDVRLATQKAVKAYVDAIVTGGASDVMIFKGLIDASANPNYPAADAGHLYKISVAGKIGGASGPSVEIGDTLFCITDATSAGNHATVGANWAISQVNTDGQIIGPASATDSGLVAFDGTTGKLVKAGPVLGTGVATALAVNVGSAGAPVVYNGAGGTPSSLALANATGLPIAGGGTGATTAASARVALQVGMTVIAIACSDETAALTVGTNKAKFINPYSTTFNVVAVVASLSTAQTSGSIFTVDLNEAGSTILSTKLTIDNTETNSGSSGTPAVISDASIAAYAEMGVDIDQVGDGTAKGLKLYVIGYPS